jgi:hypothetical protein
MLVVMDLFHIEVLAGLEVHNVDIEIIHSCLREELAQRKNFTRIWQKGLFGRCAVEKLRWFRPLCRKHTT